MNGMRLRSHIDCEMSKGRNKRSNDCCLCSTTRQRWTASSFRVAGTAGIVTLARRGLLDQATQAGKFLNGVGDQTGGTGDRDAAVVDAVFEDGAGENEAVDVGNRGGG